jgi:hypothetical protein
VLAAMNAAGYRYAASDQAFYIPAIVRQLDPSLFPVTGPLFDAQARLTAIDEIVAGVVRITGVPLQYLFLALYAGTLVLLAAAAVRIGSRLYRTGWAVAALGAALTLRHAIAKTGANTLEGYFHPRQLAFALGLWAVAMFLDRRDRGAAIFIAASVLIHPTTALWFVVWLTAAAIVDRPSRRRPILVVAGAGAIAAVIALTHGPLAGHLTIMDAAWLEAIGDKDLYPLAWPWDAWVTNLITVPIVLAGWHARRRAALTVRGETALALGSMALPLLFLCWLPFNAQHVALAIQLQAARVFWLLDALATIYLVWWLAEGTTRVAALPAGQSGAALTRRAAWLAIVLCVGSLARGVYTMFVQFPDRRLFAVDVQHGDWRDAMAFARTTDPRSVWLADPIHAARYGSSLRAAGHRDVLIEALKDRAIAMYDRGMALKVSDRLRATQEIAWDTPAGARELSRRYGLDYLVVDRQLALPLAHQSGALYIYKLR